MNWTNKYIVWGLSAMLLVSCSNENDSADSAYPENFSIAGTVQGAANTTVYLEAATQDGIVDVAKGLTDEDGKFELKGNIPGMGIYQLRLGETEENVIPLTLAPKDEVKLQTSLDRFVREPKLSGPKWTRAVNVYLANIAELAEKQNQFMLENQGEVDQAKKQAFQKKLMLKMENLAKREIDQNPSSPANIILVSALYPNMGFEMWDKGNLAYVAKVGEAFSKAYPDSPIAQNMLMQVGQLETAFSQFEQSQAQQTDGEVAPEIAMKSPEGKIIKLSDLRGKHVLIDFWASWCGPCRRENPNVVRLYQAYKDKGFTILSVSLDEDKEKWKAAILQDGLVWPNHVSDLLGWRTPMTQIYGFSGIPHTVLVDPAGKIVARNLRGEALEQKLKELL